MSYYTLKSMRDLYTGVRWYIRSLVSRYPFVYMPLVSCSRRPYDGSYRKISRQTEVLIDAYPRCANTFATFAFINAQTSPVKVAHHFHSPAAVRAAVRKEVPVLTIIRKPMDAVASALIYRDSLNVKRGLQDYIQYYSCIQELRSSVFLASFDVVTRDFGAVTKRFNKRFNKNFGVFEATVEAVERVNRDILRINTTVWENRPRGNASIEDQITLPVEARRQKKAYVENIMLLPKYRPLLDRASSIYQTLLCDADI